MRVLLWITLGLAAVWGGYWFVGSSAVKGGVETWFTTQADAGMVASHAGVSIAGFPSRFDVTVTDPHLADPVSGWGWSAPFAQVLSMTWKPWHVIAALPNSQVIEAPGQKITLESSQMRGSLRLQPSGDLTFEELVVEARDLAAGSDLGWTLGAKSLVLAMARDTTQANAQRIGLDALQVVPDPAVTAQLPNLGPEIEVIHLDATAILTGPIDRHMGEAPVGLVEIRLKDFHLNWGTLKLSATGGIAPSAEGFAEGEITFRIESWRDVPAFLVASGLVLPAMGQGITNGFEAMAQSGADPNVLILPLTFKDGRMTLGPIPLGPAPMLAQRQ